MRAAALALLSPLLAAALAAEELPVDLELVLAVDVSGSVDRWEAEQQRDGYVAALADPAVHAAIQGGYRQRIAVTYVEWASAEMQRIVIGWRLLDGAASAEAFAAELATLPITRSTYTSISHAIDFAATLFDDNGFRAPRQVIDVSGDGPNNRGRPLADARADALARGITINGLPILNDRPQPWTLPTPVEFGLDRYYEEQVIGGPGAFIVVAEDFTAELVAAVEDLDIDDLADLVEDLPIVLPRVLTMAADAPPFFAAYRYDAQDRLMISFADDRPQAQG